MTELDQKLRVELKQQADKAPRKIVRYAVRQPNGMQCEFTSKKAADADAKVLRNNGWPAEVRDMTEA